MHIFIGRHERCLSLLFVVAFLLVADSRAQLPQYQVNHPPYLQLGDAPIGDVTDQTEICWQTIPAGAGTEDLFEAQHRPIGSPTWSDTVLNAPIHTGVDGRVNHSATISGLSYDTEYEYRVNHLRAGQQIGSFQNSFRTRLPPGDPSPFTFAAYGDSADLALIQNFRSVANQINQLDATTGVAFSLLLGDTAYPLGRHRDFDARFDPTDSPEHVQYIARRIDYAGIGNHDAADGAGGQAYRDNFSVPRNGSVAGEFSEHNYSFDYGTIHFATFDSNSLSNPARLENQLEWLVTDMQASDAQWKIVFPHHPVAGSPDKGQSPADNYYQQVVSRLREANVDLFLAGHSHTYHRTQPLFGASNSQAVFLDEAGDDYTKGLGLIQLTSGVGGRTLRVGSFAQYPFTAAGFSATTEPASEFGFTQIDVTKSQLTLSYIGADQGQVKDAFTITEDLANQLVWTASTAAANWSEPNSWTPSQVPAVESIVTVENMIPDTLITSVVDTDTDVDIVLVRGRQSTASLHVPSDITLTAARGVFLDGDSVLTGEGNIVGTLNNIDGRLVIGPASLEIPLPVPEPGMSLLGWLGVVICLAMQRRG